MGSQSLQSGHKPVPHAPRQRKYEYIRQTKSNRQNREILEIRTGSDTVNEGTDGASIVPVIGEIGDGHIGDLGLDPSHQSVVFIRLKHTKDMIYDKSRVR